MLRVLERGLAIGGEPEFKHHSAHPDAPHAPFKIHLCTKNLRPEGRLTREDVEVNANVMWNYLTNQAHSGNFAGLPNVGEVLATKIHKRVLDSRLLRFSKIGTGKERHIGPLIDADECSVGSLVWGIDDLVTFGTSKGEFINEIRKANYRITDFLVLIDYDVGAAAYLENEFGVRLHSIFTVEELLSFAERENKGRPVGKELLSPAVIDAGRKFLSSSRKQPLTPQAAK